MGLEIITMTDPAGHPIGDGYFETYALLSSSGEVREFPDWISADHDTFRNRIVWTKGQQLWAMDVLGEDFGGPVMLFDVASKKEWRTPAPY